MEYGFSLQRSSKNRDREEIEIVNEKSTFSVLGLWECPLYSTALRFETGRK
jgi:hypothetical protein